MQLLLALSISLSIYNCKQIIYLHLKSGTSEVK